MEIMYAKTLKFGFSVFLLALIAIPLMHSHKVFALSGSDFNPGHIIDDSIFTNSTSMSAQNIQNFLNSEVPTCDTNHTGFTGGSGTIYNPPFVCLKDFYENPNSTYTVGFSYENTSGTTQTGSRTYYNNNAYRVTALCPVYKGYSGTPSCGSGNYKNGLDHLIPTLQTTGLGTPSGAISAAQIIYNAAQQYNINPQVLIVLLQKEQGLVTDTWPASYEYEEATGYGCPDTAPCASNYAGFSNQVISAAWQFRQYLNYPNNYNYVVGDNTIDYNPISSCGASTVAIQNQATAALYDYTPYQPNAAALANVTNSSDGGLGDSCSTYGNRNFWWYFNEWFGSTLTSNYALSFHAMAPYPSITAGQSATVWIEYQNTGGGIFYDDSLASIVGQYPLHLADTNPINRVSSFSSSSWLNNNRPSSQFVVYESDGTTLATDQDMIQPGQIVKFSYTYTVPLNTPNGTYTEWIQPVREHCPQWNVGGVGFFKITVTTPPYRANYTALQDYPSGYPGTKVGSWIRYENTGSQPWYDNTSVPTGSYPLHLADTNPINRVSIFYDPSTWLNNNRPAGNFAAVYESDGTTLAPNQHVVQPGEIAQFNITYDIPFGQTYTTYTEAIQPVLEGATDWNIGATGFINVTIKKPPDHQITYYKMSSYPTISPGSSQNVWIEYQNTGALPLYDNSSVPQGSYPLHLADTNPINRVSIFYDPSTWLNNNRPAGNFAAVYESDGTTLAPNQHIAEPGDIIKFSYNYAVPSNTTAGTYTENIEPVLELDPQWNIGGAGFFKITVP